MRQIKASEVKPGMTIRWEQDGAKIQLPVHSVEAGVASVGLVALTETQWCLGAETPVTVLAEPAPPQPEEPTEFGAKARVRGRCFLRMGEVGVGRYVWFEKWSGSRWSWDDLCEMGPVTVIPDQGWTDPAEAPEVPERIEEWPEDDEHLRAYDWRDHDGDTWGWLNGEAEWECRSSADICLGTSRRPVSGYGPWTRVSDA